MCLDLLSRDCFSALLFKTTPTLLNTSHSVDLAKETRHIQYTYNGIIVNRGEWLGSPANIKGANKDAMQDLGWKVHDRAKYFVLLSYTMHELRNQHVSIGKFLGQQ